MPRTCRKTYNLMIKFNLTPLQWDLVRVAGPTNVGLDNLPSRRALKDTVYSNKLHCRACLVPEVMPLMVPVGLVSSGAHVAGT
jgi:hypothetical protein